MKRAPLFYPAVPQEAETASQYAASAARRGVQIGQILVKWLAGQGYDSGRILDAGCGDGTVALEVARGLPHAEVVGLDLSGPMLEMARAAGSRHATMLY